VVTPVPGPSTHPARAVDTVVLDLGNVIVRWDPYAPFEGVLERWRIEAIFDEIDFFEVNRAQDAGRSWAEGRAAVAARHPHHAWVLDRYLAHFSRALPGPVPGTAEVVAALRRIGVRLLGLTNFSAETYPLVLPVAPAIGLLEDVLVSGAVGLAKPDPAIFELLIERYGLEPGRTAFVDDGARNVAAAVSCGLHGVLFTDAPALVEQLGALGLRLDVAAPPPP
jgi:2-haloacid dehalogenase